ncbi:MAG: hypothetical protein ACLPN1_02910 [Dissulfurispiraceae bacterium]
MSIETAFKALETAIERCTALQKEMNKVPVEDRGRLMRALEHLDLLEQALLVTAKELKDINNRR